MRRGLCQSHSSLDTGAKAVHHLKYGAGLRGMDAKHRTVEMYLTESSISLMLDQMIVPFWRPSVDHWPMPEVSIHLLL